MADTKMQFDIDIDQDEDNFEELPDGSTEVDIDEPKARARAKPAAEETDEGEDEIEIVDDTPEGEKKHFTPPADDADSEEADDEGVSEEEMGSYSDAVKKRFKKLTFRQRGAERARDRAEREVQAAVQMIQAQQAKLKELSSLIQNGEKQYVTATVAAMETQIATAREKLREAYEAGDPMQIADAQDQLTAARVAAANAKNYQPVAARVEREIEEVVKRAAVAPAEPVAKPHAATMKWETRNKWFSEPANKTQSMMRNYAIEFATQLEQDGYDPVADSKEYFESIDDEMRRRFPEAFRKAGGNTNTAPARRAAPSSGAGNGGTGGGGEKKKFVLTQSQARIAQKLGIPLKEYAKEYIKLYGGDKNA